jgi:hypothetical protein
MRTENPVDCVNLADPLKTDSILIIVNSTPQVTAVLKTLEDLKMKLSFDHLVVSLDGSSISMKLAVSLKPEITLSLNS